MLHKALIVSLMVATAAAIVAISVMPSAAGLTQYITISVDGQDYVMRYLIVGGRYLDAKADADNNSMTIYINATDNGMVRLEMVPEVIKAQQEPTGEDVPFIVKVDGNEISLFNDTGTVNGSRILEIPFTKGRSEIQIIGTWMVPEFPAGLAVGSLSAALVIFALMITRYRTPEGTH